ncbi:MAG: VWA domain-containing protein [Flavipsychrobacter sp.]|nr:VWA domain-containing protein [Flavipsychrobacter sp.]
MHFIFWLLAFVLSGGAGYWVYNTDKKRAVPYPWLTALLRSLVIFLTLLLVLAPVFTITRNETQKPVIVFLQDNSRSIIPALGADSGTYGKNARQLIQQLGEKYKVVQWGFGSAVQTDSLFQYHQTATDISAALTRVQDFFGRQNLGAVILATDGRFNQGMNPLYQPLALHSPLYTVAIGDSAAQKDLRVAQVYANKEVTLNSQFEIRCDIVATQCNGYSNGIQLLDGNTNVASASISITTDRYDRSVSFTVKATKPGVHHYIISAPYAAGEKNITNNRRDIFIDVVEEKKNILIASAAPHPDVNAIKEALSGLETYKVTVRTIDNFPTSLSDYQVVILHQLPMAGTKVAEEIRAAGKPVWYILGPHSDGPAITQLQRQLNVNMNMNAQHDVLANYNTTFNLFTLPQNTQAVLDKMPPLSAPLGVVQAGPSAGILFTDKQSTNSPIWLLQQGVPAAALLTGNGIWRWRLYEYKNFGNHSVVDECIRQTVAFLAANTNDKPFSVSLPKYVWRDEEPVMLNATLLNANNEQVNTPEAQITITDSAGNKHNFALERNGTAYHLNAGVWAGGTYTYAAHTVYNGKPYTANGSFVVESVPLELMETGADYPLLYGLAKKYDGSLVPAAQVASLYDSITHNQNIKPMIQTNTQTVPLVDWKWYFFLLLAIAVAEWLLRKYWLAQ